MSVRTKSKMVAENSGCYAHKNETEIEKLEVYS